MYSYRLFLFLTLYFSFYDDDLISEMKRTLIWEAVGVNTIRRVEKSIWV